MAKRNGTSLAHFLDPVADIIILSFFWVIGCVPILTVGASTTALYYATIKVVRGEGSISKDFFKSYRENLRQSVLVELIMLALALLVYICLRFAARIDGPLGSAIYVILVVPVTLWVMVLGYVFPLLSRFSQVTNVLLRNALLMSFSNFPCTVAITALNLAPLLIFLLWPAGFMRLLLIMLLLVPGLVARLNSSILTRVFQQYMPQDELESQEKPGNQ